LLESYHSFRIQCTALSIVAMTAVASAAQPLIMDPAPFPRFAKLLEACDSFAALTGGRYTRELFQDVRGDGSKGDEARSKARPVVEEFANQIAQGKCENSLLPEFRVAEKMILREAVFVSMVATCRSLGLWPANADVGRDDITYQDVSEPLDRIAQRLYNFTTLRKEAGEEQMNKSRMHAASFVVEFGREHGLRPGDPDAVSENMLFGFLQGVKEWGESTNCSDLKPCLESLPPSLQARAQAWWKENWKGVAIGGLVAAVGLAVLGAGMAWAKSQQQIKKGRKDRYDGDGIESDSEHNQNSR